MELHEAIYSRRSVRAYTDTPVDRAVIEELLAAAVQAPTGMNLQPWAFGVIQGVEAIRSYSDRAKTILLDMFGEAEWFARYKEMVSAPDYSLFYGAPALVAIYAKPTAPSAQADCCLAAGTFMLAARDKGLGSCWIGFSTGYFASQEAKMEFGVPDDYHIVAPIILGYPDGPPKPVEKNPPEILYWK
jgi:nitroreductase